MWWWLATPVTLVRAPIDPAAKLLCVSYAPFRDAQTPLVPTTQIPPEQIAQDLEQLAKISNCVRTYSIENGLDRVPELAAKVGLKVIQGIWLGSNRLKNLAQISTAVALAKEYPGVITSLVVGNEVLLRGEMTTSDLAATIRSVKAQVTVPVTYADVWEYWLRNREIYEAVDFVTIHILPYWEDFPIRAKYAAAHVDAIRKRMAVAFPAKEILVGETGWPSAGRMRDAALPSRTNQARVVSEILDLAKNENFRVNLIEAYDQPWKRQLEGTVGGYWGLIDSVQRALKYPPGEPISNYPFWKLQMASGMAMSILVFGAALLTLRRRPWTPRLLSWVAVAVSATAAGSLLGIAGDKMFYESYGIGGWLHVGPAAGGGNGRTAAVGQRVDVRARAADVSRADRPARGKDAIGSDHRIGPDVDRDHRDRRRDRARLHLRSALPRFPLCRADHGGGAVLDADASQPPAKRHPSDCGNRLCRIAGRSGALHGGQRGAGKLAIALDLRAVFPARRHAVAGAGRANPKISSPIATPERPIL